MILILVSLKCFCRHPSEPEETRLREIKGDPSLARV